VSEQHNGGNARSAAVVAAGIRDAVFRGDYVPGQRLVEVELCDAFQASRSAVRGALQQLANEGLVEVQRNRGARVRQVSRDEAVEITEVRRMLEGLIAAKAASRAGPEQVAELRQVVTAMRRAVRKHDALGYSELNAQLHAMVRQIAGHATAAAIIERLRGQVVRHQFRLALLPSRPARSLAQHEEIVEAIASADPQAAEAAMHDHLDDVLSALQGIDDAGARAVSPPGPSPAAPAGEPQAAP
jgi:DNA-binding GntR family transcriptional regulator